MRNPIAVPACIRPSTRWLAMSFCVTFCPITCPLCCRDRVLAPLKVAGNFHATVALAVALPV